MAPQALGKPYWPVPWPITQNVHSSGCPDLNWSRSSLVRGPEWSENCLLWQGK